MIHDKFCDLDGDCEDYDEGQPIPHDIVHLGTRRTEHCQRCAYTCTCAFIARIRADEQQRISQ